MTSRFARIFRAPSDARVVDPHMGTSCAQEMGEVYLMLGQLATGAGELAEAVTGLVEYAKTLEDLVLELRDEVSSLKARTAG